MEHGAESTKRRREKLMKRIINVALGALLFVLGVRVEAQQPKKVARIGYLVSSDPITESTHSEGIRQALRDLGYIEGKNIFIDWRSAEGKLDRLPGLAAELVRLKVDIIVSASPTTTRSIKDATSTIPIVMAQDADPVASGFAASLAQPGGNVTGLTTLLPEISGKRLEILRETVPRLVLVAVLGASTTPGTPAIIKGDRTCRRGVQSAASLRRRTRSQGC